MINNSGRLGKRSTDGSGLLTQTDNFVQAAYPIPKIDSFAVTNGSYVPTDDTAADPAGGQTIVLYGSGFRSGATVMVGTTVIAVVTVLDNSRITFTSPALSSGSYTVYVTNSGGGTGILVPGLVYSGMPTWSNAAGTLGSYYETTQINNTLIATGDTPMTYSLASGSLPTGSTFFANGLITGTAPVESASTTYSFTIQATDAQLQDTLRSFSLTINTDVVLWTNPSANVEYNLEQDSVMSNVALAATSAAGYAVSYAANALPTGLSITNGVVYGTPTVAASNVSLVTATAATTNRSAVRTITWTINVAGDQYWKYTSLLLNANAAVTTSSFVNDASLNNAVITVAGDTRAQNFNPYQPGYYSTYFNGSTSYNLSNQLALGSGNFTIEFWFYALDLTDRNIYEGRPSATEGAYPTIYITSSAIRYFVSSADRIVSSTISANTWYHLAVVRSAGITKMYLNGTQTGSSYTDSTTYLSGASRPIIGTYNGSAGFYYGYLSNLRVANIAFYTNTFTPSTTPLLPVAGTLFLSSQSNRIVDTSPSNFPITLSATAPTTSLATPFTTVLQAGTQYYSGYFNSSNYIYAASNAAFAPGTGDFTVEAWVYPTAAYTTYNYILGVAVTGGLVFYVTGGNLVVRAYNVADQLSSATIPSLNAWTHVAVSRSGTTLRIFVNGIQTATTTNSYNFVQGAAYVGNDSTNAAPWYGYISNFRFVKGQALYTSAFIPSTSPLTTTSQGATAANVSLLTCQSSTFIDNSTNAFAITVAGNAQPLPQSPFTPVYYSNWFNGSTDYLLTPTNSAFNLSSTVSWTLEYWVYLTTLATFQQLAFFSAGSSNSWTAAHNIDFGVNTSGNMYIEYATGSSPSIITGSTVLSINTWYHLAYVYNGSAKNITTYVNGARDLNASSMSTYTPSTTTPRVTIGRIDPVVSTPTYFVSGYISNFRITNGQTLYTSAFTPSTSPLTTTSQGATAANVSLLTCQSLYFIDTSTNVFAITTTGSPKIAGIAPFTQPGGYSATAVTTYGSGYFDGTGDYLTAPAQAALSFSTGDFTIECWAFYTAINADQGIIDCRSSGGILQSWVLNVKTGGVVDFIYSGSARLQTAGLFSINTWNHIAVTRASGTIRIFVNGVQGASVSYASAIDSNATNPNIGRAIDPAYTTGYISDLRVIKGTALYTSAFVPQFTAPLAAVTNTQLLTLQTRGAHNNSDFVDQSSFNNLVTRNGNTTNGTFDPYGNNFSTYFNGSSYQTVPYNADFNLSSSTWTLECWFNTASFASGFTIISKDTNGSNYDWGLYIASSTSIACYTARTASSFIATVPTMTVGTWYHVAFVRNAGTFKIYLNGTSYSGSSSMSFTNESLTTPTIGCSSYNSPNAYTTGYVSNLRLVQGTAVYTTTFTPSTAPLSAVAGTVLLICQNNRFIDSSPKNYTVTNAGGTPQVQKFSPFATVTVPTYYSGYFDGTGDYLNIAAGNTALNLGTGDFTLECWIYATSSGTSAIVDNRNPDTANAGFDLDWLTPNKIRFSTSGTAFIDSATTVSTNTWYHLALTRSSNLFKLYINGTVDSNTYTGSSTQNFTNTNFRIGSGQNGAFSGYISNLRITKGQVLYTTNFTPSTTPLTTTSQGATAANVSLLTCQSNTIIDNSPNYLAITANGDAKPLAVSPFTPTASSPVSYTPTTFGGSMYFDGTGDYLVGPASNTNLYPGAGDFTIDFWNYLPANPTTGYYTVFGYGSATPNLLMFYTAATSKIEIFNNATVKLNPSWPAAGQWNHFALVRSGTTLSIYINGVFSQSTTEASNFVGTLYIGADFNGARNILGYISDFRIVKGTALYTANFYPGASPATPTYTIGTTTYSSNLLLSGATGGVIDFSRTVDLETVADAKVTPFSPYNTTYYSNLFDGGTSYFTGTTAVAFPIGTETFTVEMWLNKSNAWNTGNQVLLISSTASSFQLWVDASVPAIKVSFNGGATPLSYSTSGLALGTWYHLAVVRSGSSFTMYVNGVSVATGTNSGSFATPSSIIIGNFTSGTTSGWNGYVSNLRIVRGTAVYTGNFTPSTTPLTAVSGTSLLTCQSNKFVDNSTNALTLTPSGTPKVQTQNPFALNTGISYYFDGTGDYLASPASAMYDFGTGDFTIEFWMNASAAGTYTPVVGTQSIAGNGTAGMWRVSNRLNSANGIYFNYSTGSAFTDVTFTTTNYNDNSWHYVAITRSSNVLRAFVDGVKVGSDVAITQSLSSGQRLYVGFQAQDSVYYTGYIADLRITRGSARYTGAFTPPTSPLGNK